VKISCDTGGEVTAYASHANPASIAQIFSNSKMCAERLE
jgi:hypothetical protein